MIGSLVGKIEPLTSLSCVFRFAAIASCWVLVGTSLASEPSLTRLGKTTRELLKNEATAELNTPSKDRAISALCDLYVILRRDPRYATSSMLQGDAVKVRRRLISVSKRRMNQLERSGIPKPPGLSAAVDQAVRRAVQASLSQQENGDESEDEEDTNRAFAPAALAASPWQLIELIQRVVAPDLWDVRGGSSTIQYFAMRRVLVVRATTEVHEQIRDLLMALR